MFFICDHRIQYSIRISNRIENENLIANRVHNKNRFLIRFGKTSLFKNPTVIYIVITSFIQKNLIISKQY